MTVPRLPDDLIVKEVKEAIKKKVSIDKLIKQMDNKYGGIVGVSRKYIYEIYDHFQKEK